MFHFGSTARAQRGVEAATEAPLAPTAVDEAKTVGRTDIPHSSTRDVVELLEADLRRAGHRMEGEGRKAKESVGEAIAIIDDLRHEAEGLVDQTETAKRNLSTLAEGFDELHQTAEEIGRRAETSQRLVDDAVEVAKVAAASVAELKVAIEQIQAVVSLISDVAGQTNLLALNATIEAARAGAAGRGFAVVASEVKSLSVETQKATNEIGATIGRLRTTAEANIAAVDRIVGLVGEIGPVFGEVSQSVRMQIGTTAEIGRSTNETVHFAEAVAGRARQMSEGMARAAALGREAAGATDTMNAAVEGMNRQLVTVLRQTPEADRRSHDRWPVEKRGRITAAGRTVGFRTIDLSLGGALVVPESDLAVSAGARLELEIAGLATFPARLVGRSTQGLHVEFVDLRGEAEARLAAEIARLDAEFRPMIERAERAATRIRSAIETAIAGGSLSLADLFDTRYREIPGSAPVQYETAALAALDRILPTVQEAVLTEDRRMAFCAAVDVNGWLPVHNKIYSQPQRPGDVLWNTANSRNRRIYDDRTGLLAARNTRPFLVQSYLRDLGGGKIVPMKEVDIPLVIQGRPWGGLRSGYAM
jgi:methyl-accepting chemotaxis protein